MKQQLLEAQVAHMQEEIDVLRNELDRMRDQRDVAEHQLSHAVQQHEALFIRHERAMAALAHYAIIAAEGGQPCSGI